MTNDQWQMKNDKLYARNESTNPSSFICHWSFAIGHLPLVICHWSLVICSCSLRLCGILLWRVPWSQKPGLVKLLLRGRRIRDANDLGLCHLFRSEYDGNGSQLFRAGHRDFKARPRFRLFDPGCKTVQLDAIPVHCDQLVVYVEALVISRRAFRNPDNDNPSLDGFCVDPQIS